MKSVNGYNMSVILFSFLGTSRVGAVKFRVPGSAMLQQYYRMVGANPTPVAWGETPSAIKQGVADALDPSVGALYVFGFADILSHVTFTQAVPDSQVYSVNLEWFNSLPAAVLLVVIGFSSPRPFEVSLDASTPRSASAWRTAAARCSESVRFLASLSRSSV